jgi:hypothetical protein
VYRFYLERKKLEGNREAIHLEIGSPSRNSHREMRIRLGDEIVDPRIARALEEVLAAGLHALGGQLTVELTGLRDP